MTLHEAIETREAMGPELAICDACSMRGRYRPGEIARVGLEYLKAS